MRLESPAFAAEADIPERYTCRGRNLSPPLRWEAPPEGTKSFALLVEDPDTPFGTVTHWVAYNIPPGRRELAEGAGGRAHSETGLAQGRNGLRREGYMGPCPPWGRHRYVFTLYALDAVLRQDRRMTKRRLLRAMRGHIIDSARLLGRFGRK